MINTALFITKWDLGLPRDSYIYTAKHLVLVISIVSRFVNKQLS